MGRVRNVPSLSTAFFKSCQEKTVHYNQYSALIKSEQEDYTLYSIAYQLDRDWVKATPQDIERIIRDRHQTFRAAFLSCLESLLQVWEESARCIIALPISISSACLYVETILMR